MGPLISNPSHVLVPGPPHLQHRLSPSALRAEKLPGPDSKANVELGRGLAYGSLFPPPQTPQAQAPALPKKGLAVPCDRASAFLRAALPPPHTDTPQSPLLRKDGRLRHNFYFLLNRCSQTCSHKTN